MPSHDLERQKRTTQLLATKVGNLWPCLPHELCLMISALVVREYTVSVFQGLWAARHQLPNHNVDVSQSIWVRYSDMGGAKYVYELSNTGGRCFRKLFDPEISPDPGVLYVLEDHLGVRDLVFHNPESKRMRLPSGNHERGTWWRVISLPYKLQVEYDVGVFSVPARG
ncbi:hypothetical protein B0T21DRAFT_281405 [Apiosordaria backusii]|uniref:Uncharacterized protein n=1 Tax=Apiosordaria backusii TaxID=314023 RepID=A0AA40K3Z6_9PEZI|nr:hypothetical protein B0T21DRAFT_281405 [Apiosordaria backusii]